MASIEQRRGKRGTTWRVIWREDGEKQSERFGTPAAAEQFKMLVEGSGNRWPRGWIPGVGFKTADEQMPTFAEYAVRSIESRALANDRTRHDYLRDVRLHLNPTFGHKRLDEITREDVGRWLIEFGRIRSDKTVKNVHNLASSIMADAIESRLIGYNPFRRAYKKIAGVRVEEMIFLTRVEFNELYKRIPALWQTFVLMLAFTGMRWSEATALKVFDIDLRLGTVTIVRAWKRQPDNSMKIGEPKSRRARRTLILPPALLAALKTAIGGRDPSEWLFTTVTGRPVHHGNFRSRVWLPAVKGIVKTPRIHDLRHSHASWLIEAQVPLPAIQRRLGHESITTTVDRYGHLTNDMDATITSALDPVIDGAITEDVENLRALRPITDGDSDSSGDGSDVDDE